MTRHCFQIFGFDVLIDDHCRPWLLEVNASPSLAIGTMIETSPGVREMKRSKIGRQPTTLHTICQYILLSRVAVHPRLTLCLCGCCVDEYVKLKCVSGALRLMRGADGCRDVDYTCLIGAHHDAPPPCAGAGSAEERKEVHPAAVVLAAAAGVLLDSKMDLFQQLRYTTSNAHSHHTSIHFLYIQLLEV